MKKFFTILAFILAVAVVFISCTEEEVKPASDNTNGSQGSTKGF